MVAIMEGIVSEGIHSAIVTPWPADRQRSHLISLSARESAFVALTEQRRVIGYVTLELWAPTLESMAHAGQLGTFLGRGWRRQGIGAALFRAALDFARERGFSKLVVMVRSSNAAAQGFYQRLGFRECGRLTRQVRIGEQEDDEILMEFFCEIEVKGRRQDRLPHA